MARNKAGISFSITKTSIRTTNSKIKMIAGMVFGLQSQYMNQSHKSIYTWAKRWTMVATGETRSKLFNVSKMYGIYRKYTTGYMPTTNNQSEAQEFEVGPVHKSKVQHRYSDGSPKCSTEPHNIFASLGKGYSENRFARRRALALAVGKVYGSPVKFAVKESGNLRYQPNLMPMVRRLRKRAMAVTNSV